MSHIDVGNHWKDILPSAFSWLESCPTKTVDGIQKGAHHAILLQGGKSDAKSSSNDFRIDAPDLSEKLKSGLKQSAQALGVQKGSGSTILVHDDHLYILVWTPEISVTEQQKGQQIGLEIAKVLKGLDYTHLVLCAGEKIEALALYSGVTQGFYKLDGFKGNPQNEKDPSKLPGQLSLIDKRANAETISQAKAMSRALCLTRAVEDAPANWMSPERFSEISRDISKEYGLRCDVKTLDELKKLGMGAFVSVAGGSSMSPQMITIEIEGSDPSKTVALVGKGLTFDVGGLCLKPAGGLEEMKYDMCGGGSVLGTAFYLAQVKPACNVVCLIGAVENLVGEDATRPGDIVTAMNGKTIEVINTDAEGRLVLADVLCYANKIFKPDLMIDVATLTGAVLMALGSSGAGLMSNQQEAADFVLEQAKAEGEPVWQLPMWPELAKEIKAEFADLKNITAPGVRAGTISAATFLQEFVEDTPWVHLDIAGTAWTAKITGYPSTGASGFIVRTLAAACMNFKGMAARP